jgi:hypothetical protein
VNYE